jgi:hypothetical protein
MGHSLHFYFQWKNIKISYFNLTYMPRVFYQFYLKAGTIHEVTCTRDRRSQVR